MSFQRFLDLRYEGQEFSIQVPVSAEEIEKGDLATIRSRFDSIHDRSFGHAAPDEPLEVVNVRLTVRGKRQKILMPAVAKGKRPVAAGTREVCLEQTDRYIKCPVYSRPSLPAGGRIAGPAIIEEYASTTVLFEGDRATVSGTGAIIVKVGAAR